jgi:hypothetical protein
VKRALYELTETSRHLNYLANHATESSQMHGDDWDIIGDAAIDAALALKSALKRLTKKTK